MTWLYDSGNKVKLKMQADDATDPAHSPAPDPALSLSPTPALLPDPAPSAAPAPSPNQMTVMYMVSSSKTM
ncbi:hypothetical protein SERLADRAFT_439847 [Serpula lacrymans var. lacrymans S7.9]|uniref:Uncharacterized protein n=1 Tax=Serpula lacrymans var. lacrymans (strain S7.9) TaxID=578457 RepID=F8P1S2_SERL9|nr:uncharacterized protein SERLADRAFT_439847 [Serpula lacrymans var. lacrymans S7.9]EGO23101.1 hypothetical protein SERLADRAFT_439847 [Serpula lacrymans var. lacrymans S7.9]